jgi:hypothetical protein
MSGVTVFQCLSCRPPLLRGVVHGSSAESAAALAAAGVLLKTLLSLREKNTQAPSRDTSIGPAGSVVATTSIAAASHSSTRGTGVQACRITND